MISAGIGVNKSNVSSLTGVTAYDSLFVTIDAPEQNLYSVGCPYLECILGVAGFLS